MRAVVIGNRNDADAGAIGAGLDRRGYTLDPLAREADGSWPALDADVILVLGSDWSVYWDHVSEAVEREAAHLRAAHDAGVPILGICFGSQILAHALGGSVHLATETEIGWYRVEPEPTAPAALDPGPWFQWHQDTFVPPPGAEVLARSSVGPQAYRLGRTLAVQFHPEVDASIVGRWSSGPGAQRALAERGTNRADLLALTERETPAAHAKADRLLEWYLTDVAQARP